METPFTYGSACSGIEAATVAWGPLGWKPAFFAEVDAFPSAVLAHHYPGTPNLGDFTRIEAAQGSIDLLVGGTPCQSFSVAGLRGGLDDDRGNLALEYLRLAGRLRPTWIVWENVPGVLSSNGGRDFGAFLGALGELGYGWAYRVLDAQFFGVPQRRRRVFVVGHLGDWRRPAAVLFERESLRGDTPEGREAKSDLAPSVTPGARRASGQRSGEQLVAHSLRADGFDASEDGTGRGTPLIPVAYGGNNTSGPIDVATARNGHAVPHGRLDFETETFIAYQCHGNNVGPAGTFRSGNQGVTGGVPFIINAAESCAKQSHARPAEVARCIDGTGSFANAQGGTVALQPRPMDVYKCGECAYTQEHLEHRTVCPVCESDSYENIMIRPTMGPNAGMVFDFHSDPQGFVAPEPIPFDTTQITSDKNYSNPRAGDTCHPLARGQHAPAIAFQERGREGGPSLESQSDIAYSLNAPSGGGRRQEMNIATRSAVRRLTPRECERLQGFPDDYTLVSHRGKPAADGPRYKAIGNSMAVPVMAWIGRRIDLVRRIPQD